MNNVTAVTNGEIIGYVEGGVYSDFSSPTKYGKVAPIAGHLLETFKGRLLVAKGNVIYYSGTMAPNQFDLRRNFKQLPGRITMLKAVDDGLYLSDGEKTYFASGRDMQDLALEPVAEYGAIPWAAQRVDAGLVGVEGFKGHVVFWVSEEGICVGGDGGSYRNLTQRRYAPPEGRSYGAGLFRKDKSQYIIALHN
jgi:hypothetical protein